jgi:DNA-binding response OmpR family regulator
VSSPARPDDRPGVGGGPAPGGIPVGLNPPARVLIVEDDPPVRELLRDCLRRPDLGYVVEVVTTGADALEVVHRRRPDVILLDVGLPDFSGLDVLKLVRQLQASIPVILITGRRDARTVTEAMDSGAFAYIPKPVSLAYVETLVAAALRLRPRAPLS